MRSFEEWCSLSYDFFTFDNCESESWIKLSIYSLRSNWYHLHFPKEEISPSTERHSGAASFHVQEFRVTDPNVSSAVEVLLQRGSSFPGFTKERQTCSKTFQGSSFIKETSKNTSCMHTLKGLLRLWRLLKISTLLVAKTQETFNIVHWSLL